ncbi:unnamed protein product [Alternaria alternata]
MAWWVCAAPLDPYSSRRASQLTQSAQPFFQQTSVLQKSQSAGLKRHITPLSTVNKAIDAFLADDTLTGQAVELSQENIYFRQPVDYPNESQRWIGEESDKIWNLGYQEPPKRQGY